MRFKNRQRSMGLLLVACTATWTGCTVLNETEDAKGLSRWSKLLPNSIEHGHEAKSDSVTADRIVNPPARTIRFDGHEIVLGNAESTVWSTEQLLRNLQPLVQKQKLRSASQIVLQHLEASERLLLERWATESQKPEIAFVADVLDRRTPQATASWKSLFQHATTHADAARIYQQHRNAFATTLQTSDPSNQDSMQLLDTAQKLAHPLILTDSLRLLALRAMIAERWQESESHYNQAIAVADSAQLTSQASDLRIAYAECLKRSGRQAIASAVWSVAVQSQMSHLREAEPFDVGFWLRADHARPEGATWPEDLVRACSKYTTRLGVSSEGPAEMQLWASIADAELRRGDVQQALVHFKKSEVVANNDDKAWLRIAQSKCLTALGQIPAATAILASPASSDQAKLAATASAALGSTKLQSGAYQQGAQLLNKAITQHSDLDWPYKTESLADLALAQLIIGDTNSGLESLHKVQDKFEVQHDWSSLLQSLENEARLLEHEGRTSDVEAIYKRINSLELGV